MTTARPLRFFLYGYYGSGNFGDDLLLKAALQGLRALAPGASFLIRDHGLLSRDDQADGDVSYSCQEHLLSDQTQPAWRRALRYLAAHRAIFRKCDWLIFGGGTLFHTHGSLLPLALQFALCAVARLCGLRIAALGVGVGRLNSLPARWLMRGIIAMATVFLVRDEAALAQCGPSKAQLTEDLVFTLPSPATIAPPEPPHIAIALYPPALSGNTGADLLDSLAAVIAAWLDKGHKITFLAFQAGNDEPLLAQLRNRIPHAGAGAIETRILQAGSSDMAEGLARLSLYCGMRFHGLVIAAMVGLPFVGIAHDSKISEICRRFGMPSIDIAAVSPARLEEVATIVATSQIDAAQLERSRNAAQLNFTYLSKFLP